MKNFMRAVICSFIISVLLSMIPFEASCKNLNEDVLRLHILANSDSDSDQKLKLKVRDAVLSEMSPLYNGVTDKSQAQNITKQNLKNIENIAQRTVYDNGYDYQVTAKIKNIYFNTRYYDDFTMPAGMYDALQIVIGSGEGHNWWCVMYPTLCVGSASEQAMKENLSTSEYDVIKNDNYVFKFKIVEYYEKIASVFR